MKITYEGPTWRSGPITANFYYDDQDPDNAGWYAEYYDKDGTVIDDSMKVWHEEMPRRRDAKRKAERIVRRHLQHLAERRRDNPSWARVFG